MRPERWWAGFRAGGERSGGDGGGELFPGAVEHHDADGQADGGGGSSDTLVTNALAVAVKVSTKLALSVGYALQDNTKPPAGLKRVDSLETVNLVYSF